MPLLEDGVLVPDRWQAIDDRQPLPAGDCIVSPARFLEERATLLDRPGRVGVRLRNTDPIEPLVGDLSRLALIVLEFPKFTDGRAYSQARRLRERHGYRGTLRASGDVLPDQYLFMRRCGFDSFEISSPVSTEAWRRAEASFTAFYQPAGDDGAPIGALRLALARHRSTPGSERHADGATAGPGRAHHVGTSGPHRNVPTALPDSPPVCSIDAD